MWPRCGSTLAGSLASDLTSSLCVLSWCGRVGFGSAFFRALISLRNGSFEGNQTLFGSSSVLENLLMVLEGSFLCFRIWGGVTLISGTLSLSLWISGLGLKMTRPRSGWNSDAMFLTVIVIAFNSATKLLPLSSLSFGCLGPSGEVGEGRVMWRLGEEGVGDVSW